MILIQTFVLLIGFSLFPSKSDAVCNTANFTKDITAARLTLADGTVFSNIVVQRGTLQTQPNVSSNNFKDLNLLFIIKADDDATLNYIKTGDRKSVV